MMSRTSSTTLRIGDEAPEFALPGLDGEIVELTEARGICGVVLLFTPGAWSPATRRQLGEVNAVYERFRENGVQVVVVMTQSAAVLRDRLASYAIPFPILADEHRQIAREYGVFRAMSWDGFAVTRPAAFMIDRDGIIRFMYVGHRDTDLMDTESLLKLSVWLVSVPPVEQVPEPEIELDFADEVESEVEVVLDQEGMVVAELRPVEELEPETDAPERNGHDEAVAVQPTGNGQHAETPEAAGTQGEAEKRDEGSQDELTVAGASENDRPHV